MSKTQTLHTHSFSGFQVELSPATDRWMMGDQWGIIETVNFETGMVRLKMRRSGKMLFCPVTLLMPREDIRALVEACGYILDLENGNAIRLK